ncbi:hypothetical protein EV421DRAFT_1732138 [Armillaria borealis]|uniref:Uncharacterized protein n=1 Tax=Armillaria borealis TaxID=47425 RepID=A0AA39JW57_9AGAR|nr:hypothetical protein EV421DRAFT_1732138 [Armillaria borealis]
MTVKRRQGEEEPVVAEEECSHDEAMVGPATDPSERFKWVLYIHEEMDVPPSGVLDLASLSKNDALHLLHHSRKKFWRYPKASEGSGRLQRLKGMRGGDDERRMMDQPGTSDLCVQAVSARKNRITALVMKLGHRHTNSGILGDMWQERVNLVGGDAADSTRVLLASTSNRDKVELRMRGINTAIQGPAHVMAYTRKSLFCPSSRLKTVWLRRKVVNLEGRKVVPE